MVLNKKPQGLLVRIGGVRGVKGSLSLCPFIHGRYRRVSFSLSVRGRGWGGAREQSARARNDRRCTGCYTMQGCGDVCTLLDVGAGGTYIKSPKNRKCIGQKVTPLPQTKSVPKSGGAREMGENPNSLYT